MVGAELNQHIYQFCMDLLGPEGVLYRGYPGRRSAAKDEDDEADWRGPIQQRFLRSRANTIEGGTSDVMRKFSASGSWVCPVICGPTPACRGRRSPVARVSSTFIFSPEQAQPRSAVRKFSTENFDESTVRRLMESDPPFDPAVWARLRAELGVLALSVPEADGGVGGSLVDQAVAVEVLGASLAGGPLFGTVFLAIPALVAASAGSVRDALLAEFVEGRHTAAFAVADRAGASTPRWSGCVPPDRLPRPP
jgi:hypothetical protein